MDAATTWSLLSTLVSFAIGLALHGALLVIALGPVRRHRPDAAGLFLAAALVMIATSIAGPLLQTAVSLVAARSGVDAMLRISALVGMAFGLANAAGWALLLAGIARIATPRRVDPREPS